MSVDTGVLLLGIKGAKDALDSLAPKLRNRAMRTVFRRLAYIAKGEAAANAPVKTGALRRSLKVRAIKRNRRGIVGVNVISSFAGNNQYYGTFQEFGTQERRTKRGKSTGRTRPLRWMGRAFESKADQMMSEGQELLKREIEQLAREGSK